MLQNGEALFNDHTHSPVPTPTALQRMESEFETHQQRFRCAPRIDICLRIFGPISQVVWLGHFLNGFWHCVAGSKKDPLLSKENKTGIRNIGEAEEAEVSCQSEEGASRRVRNLDKYFHLSRGVKLLQICGSSDSTGIVSICSVPRQLFLLAELSLPFQDPIKRPQIKDSLDSFH